MNCLSGRRLWLLRRFWDLKILPALSYRITCNQEGQSYTISSPSLNALLTAGRLSDTQNVSSRTAESTMSRKAFRRAWSDA